MELITKDIMGELKGIIPRKNKMVIYILMGLTIINAITDVFLVNVKWKCPEIMIWSVFFFGIATFITFVTSVCFGFKNKQETDSLDAIDKDIENGKEGKRKNNQNVINKTARALKKWRSKDWNDEQRE